MSRPLRTGPGGLETDRPRGPEAEAVRLEDLVPRVPPMKRLARLSGFGLVLLALAVSLHASRVDLPRLWQHRNNGIEHFFGRRLTDAERAEAREDALRFASEAFHREATETVRRRYLEQGRPFDSMRAFREIQEESERLLDQIGPEQRERIVRERCHQVVSEKRGGYFPPDFSWPKTRLALQKLGETVAMAVWGTLFAFMAAVPAGILAAGNTLEIIASGDAWPQRALRWFATFVLRRFFDFCRSFNEFVMGLIFVAIVGLGPFAGVLALAVHTFGILSKVFSEAIESIDPRQVEGVTATGARSTHVIGFAVVPQLMPIIISYSLLRFESNVRSATVLGFVGAGGIGMLFIDKFQGYMLQDVCAIMILILATVSLIDVATSRLRRRFI